jgi:hypothetical protein
MKSFIVFIIFLSIPSLAYFTYEKKEVLITECSVLEERYIETYTGYRGIENTFLSDIGTTETINGKLIKSRMNKRDIKNSFLNNKGYYSTKFPKRNNLYLDHSENYIIETNIFISSTSENFNFQRKHYGIDSDMRKYRYDNCMKALNEKTPIVVTSLFGSSSIDFE